LRTFAVLPKGKADSRTRTRIPLLGGAALGGGASRVASQKFLSLGGAALGGGASRVASQKFLPLGGAALGGGASRVASQKFLSLGGAALGGGASRVASQEIPLPRRGGERSETEWLGILGISDHPAPKGHPSKGGEFSPDRYAMCRLLRGRLRLALALPTPTALRSIPPGLDWPKLGGSQGRCPDRPAQTCPGSRSDSAGRCCSSCHRSRPGPSRCCPGCTGRSLAT